MSSYILTKVETPHVPASRRRRQLQLLQDLCQLLSEQRIRPRQVVLLVERRQVVVNAKIIDDSQTLDGLAALGGRVVILESGFDDEKVYTIFGSTETDPANGRISNVSPIGNALIGRTAGEVVRVKAPKGEIEFEIVRVE